MLDYYLAYEAKTYQQKEREPNWQNERQAALDTSGEKGTKHRTEGKRISQAGAEGMTKPERERKGG